MPTQSSIQVIDRAAHLLDALSTTSDPISLKVLSAETRLHPSTAFRILRALVAHGLVERTTEGRYRLGIKLLRYGGRVREQMDWIEQARPMIAHLRAQVDETVNLTVREGDEVVYVERSIPNRMMRVEQIIGSRAPLHVTAVGKLFLAESGKDDCLDYARRTGLPRYTPNSITGARKLWEEAENAARRGYALDNEEAEVGVGCIGVAIHDSHGVMIGGLSISAPRSRRQNSWIPLIQKVGAQISARLGYNKT